MAGWRLGHRGRRRAGRMGGWRLESDQGRMREEGRETGQKEKRSERVG